MIRLLKLQSLKTRRQLACLKLLFDISNNLKFVEDKIKPTRQRCTNIRYQRQHARVKVYENSYFLLQLNYGTSYLQRYQMN